MGNCFTKSKKSTAEIVPHHDHSTTVRLFGSATAEILPHHDHSTTVRLFGSASGTNTAYVRLALLHKSVSHRFTASVADTPLLQVGSERISGTRDILFQYIESKFPQPPLLLRGVSGDDRTTPLPVRATALQHKSIAWHVDRLVRWAEDLGSRGGKKKGNGGVDPTVGTPRMEVRKFARSYSQLLEMMLEHAQMEERVLFPILDVDDPGEVYPIILLHLNRSNSHHNY